MSRQYLLDLEFVIYATAAVALAALAQTESSEVWSGVCTVMSWYCIVVALRRGWQAWRLDRKETDR